MTKQNKGIYKTLATHLSSRNFLIGVIVFFVLESLWVAFSFRYPMIYDEYAHLNFIKAYADSLSPYSTHVLGNMTMPISLFHYLLSFIYRLFDFFGAGQYVIVLVLRIANIAMVAAGLFIYAKLLKSVGLRQVYINLGLLIFALLPITSLVAATINYDNMLFPLVAIYLYACVKVIQQKDPSLMNAITLLTIGLLASLVKYEFLPMFLATVCFLSVIHIRRYGIEKSINSTLATLRKKSKKTIALSTAFIVLFSAASLMYGGDLIRYHKLLPSCFDLESEQVCMKNPVVARNKIAVETLSERSVVNPLTYIENIWFKNMMVSTLWSGNSTTSGAAAFGAPLPVMNVILDLGIVLGAAVTLYMWRTIKKSLSWKFLVAVAIFWVFVILIVNLNGYYTFHAAYAIQPRYLLIISPILITLVVYSTSEALKRIKWLQIMCLCVVLLGFSQGGGVITHILRGQDSWYWDNPRVMDINHAAKKILSPLVKGG